MSLSKRSDETSYGCGYAIAALLIAPASTIWRGYVLSVLWRWFVTPTFALPLLSIPAALGLSCLVNSIVCHPADAAKEKDEASIHERFIKNLFIAFMAPGLALGMGAIFNHWM